MSPSTWQRLEIFIACASSPTIIGTSAFNVSPHAMKNDAFLKQKQTIHKPNSLPSFSRQNSIAFSSNRDFDDFDGETYLFDPFQLSQNNDNSFDSIPTNNKLATTSPPSTLTYLLAATAAITTTLLPLPSTAKSPIDLLYASPQFDPANFKPVCATSDGFYRFLQGTTQAVVGPENFVEYGPLIAGGLLRIRLELCVVESFFNEAVGPFIQQNGIGWVLPLHESVETFLAGTIFALATTFILVGSTKIVSVIVTYGDAFVGGPCRLLGGFAFDRALGKPVALDIGVGRFKKRLVGPPVDFSVKKSKAQRLLEEEEEEDWVKLLEDVSPVAYPALLASGGVKGVGETSKFIREVTDALDLFVGRYLTLLATGYIGIKFLHFKIFPEFPPFG